MVFLCALSLTSVAQYGNEWISYSQSYYKIQIAENKIFQLNYSTLQSAGIPVDQIDPRSFQIFHNGNQEYIWVEGQSDSKFDPDDFILFYGEKNDGKLDTELFRDPSEQGHTFSSLYTDSSAYFLTWGKTNNTRRYKNKTDQDLTGLVADNYYINNVHKWFNSNWYDGSRFHQYGSHSLYTEGEGWMSSDVRAGLSLYALPTPGFIETSGIDIEFEVLGFGKSDPTQTKDFDKDGNNHELSVYYENSNNLLATNRGRGYCKHFITGVIPSSLFKDISKMGFNSSFGAYQRQALSYFTIRYPRSFKGISDNNLILELSSLNPLIELQNYSGSISLPLIWDLNTKEFIIASQSAGKLKFKISPTGKNKLLIADSSVIIQSLGTSELSPVIFNEFNHSSQAEYLIVTNKKLQDGAKAYSDYRNSAAGGGYRTAVVYVDELYDQYYYGVHHPLAIKNFLKANWNKGGKTLQYLMLLGKGQSYYLYTNNPARRIGLDLVPTVGYPPSDYLFSAGLENSRFKPEIATGRLPAKSNTEINLYLAKVKEHEQSLKNASNWKKNVIQLSGGGNKNENNQFKAYLKTFSEIIENDSFGGNVTLFSKDQSVVIQENLTSSIIDKVDEGATMLNYFGHGSSDVLEIDIGFPNQFNNTSKYPLFYFNGCILGNTYDQNSLGEKFLLEPSLGAINWLASTNYAFTSILYDYGRQFHVNFFRDYYGKTIGQTHLQTIHDYYNDIDDFKMSMCHQFVCSGDPAISYFSPKKPDFTIDQAETKLNPGIFPVNVDSVSFDIGIFNLGKTGTDKLEVEITRTNTSGINKVYNFSFSAPTNQGVFKVKFENNDTFSGLNQLKLEIDPANKISEQSPVGESNNTWTTNFFVPSDNIFVSSPLANEIITKIEVTLEVRSASNTTKPILVQFELDTNAAFNSPIVFRESVQGTSLFKSTMQLLAKDSLDYYWRARVAGKDNPWVNGNFALIFNSEIGASQSNPDLVNRGSFDQLYLDSSGEYSFSSTLSQLYNLQIAGQSGSSRRGLRINGRLARMFWFYQSGMQMIAFNPRDESRYMVQSQFNTLSPTDPLRWGYTELVNSPYYIQGNTTGVYQFNTLLIEHQDSLVEFLKGVPDDYYLFVYNGSETGIESWKPELFEQFNKFGFTDLKNRVKEGWPFGLRGSKNDPAGAIQEYADSNNLVITPPNQVYSVPSTIPIPQPSGSFTTESVGPAKAWGKAHFSLQDDIDNLGDRYSIDVIGINRDQQQVNLMSVMGQTVDLSNIDADEYNYIKLKIHLIDSVRKTSSQINRWVVSFTPSPDGNLIQTETRILNDSVKQGQNIIVVSTFENIGNDSFDASSYHIAVYNSNNSLVDEIRDSFEIIAPRAEIQHRDTIETINLKGNGSILVNYNPKREPTEPNFLNNSSIHNYYVESYRANAIADIKIDGRIIMDRELVSSSPFISVHVLQLDSFIKYDDLAHYELFIKYPGVDSFSPVDLYSPEVDFIPASKVGGSHTLSIQKEKLVDGVYEVLAKISNPIDLSKVDEVQARFKVISKMAVSNVYFYPSPFTTQSKIVYTLTGEFPPDEFRVDIYTVTGRRVRSIDLHLEEDLSVGTHISNFTWDGSDQYGDRLANGVYLYKTTVRQDGKVLEHHEQSNDHLFEQGFGKLYILR